MSRTGWQPPNFFVIPPPAHASRRNVSLGYIIKTHGLRGHVVAHFDVDDAKAYQKLKTVYLALAGAPPSWWSTK
ncbi:hypothetical protein ACFQT0_10765 [Hymenobacter humi]|uniref:RimM N-terminal domain-containing protein n=1 Tax=Hymenobacter humi TaxID=1411620 RepID=A0ABW2U382_9BACT